MSGATPDMRVDARIRPRSLSPPRTPLESLDTSVCKPLVGRCTASPPWKPLTTRVLYKFSTAVVTPCRQTLVPHQAPQSPGRLVTTISDYLLILAVVEISSSTRALQTSVGSWYTFALTGLDIFSYMMNLFVSVSGRNPL